MEKQLKCFLLMSLKEMALRRVAVLLWSGSDILASISKFKLCAIGGKEWQEAVDFKIKDKVLELELPESLSKQVLDRIRPVSLEVEAFVSNHSFLRNLNNEIILPDSAKLCWTTAGTINYKRTAEEILRCDKLDVERRYELACWHCMEDYISLYWEELPAEKKWKYCHRKDQSPDLSYCWPHILKGEHFQLDYLLRRSNRNMSSFNQWAFEHSAEKLRKTAAEYFLKKLTHEEREASLMRTALTLTENRFGLKKSSDVLRYLLSVMTPEQQVETIKARPVDVFLRFLYWPLQDLFLDNAGFLWTFIPPSSYKFLIDKIFFAYYNQCFPTMFKEFFMGSPPDFKKCFVEEEYMYGHTLASCFLSEFFRSDDSESIKVILRSLDAADRVKLVCQWRVLQLFYLHMDDGWHVVEVCLRETELPKEEKVRLKNKFKEYLEGRGESVNVKFKRFFEFLGETDASSDKREKGQKRKLGNCSQDQ